MPSEAGEDPMRAGRRGDRGIEGEANRGRRGRRQNAALEENDSTKKYRIIRNAMLR